MSQNNPVSIKAFGLNAQHRSLSSSTVHDDQMHRSPRLLASGRKRFASPKIEAAQSGIMNPSFDGLY